MFDFNKLPSWAQSLPPVALARGADSIFGRKRVPDVPGVPIPPGTPEEVRSLILTGDDGLGAPSGLEEATRGVYGGGYSGLARAAAAAPAESPTPTVPYEEAASIVSGGAPAAVPQFRGESAFVAAPEWGGVDFGPSGGPFGEPSSGGLKTRAQMETDLGAHDLINAGHEQAMGAIAAEEARNDPTLKQIAARKKELEYERLLPYGSRPTMRFTDPSRGIREMTPDVQGEDHEFGTPTAAEGTASTIANALARAKALAANQDPKVRQEEERRKMVGRELEQMESDIKAGLPREQAERRLALRIQALTGLSLAEVFREPKADGTAGVLADAAANAAATPR